MKKNLDRYDGFDGWADVQAQFRMDEPKPTEVLAAVYETGNYEGSAEVIYRKGRKYYTVSGGHCSCYGLEGQWDPEEYPTKKLFIEVLKKGTWGLSDRVRKNVLEILKAESK